MGSGLLCRIREAGETLSRDVPQPPTCSPGSQTRLVTVDLELEEGGCLCFSTLHPSDGPLLFSFGVCWRGRCLTMMSRLGIEACTIITSLKLLLEELFPSRDLSLIIHLTNCWWLLPLIALTGENKVEIHSMLLTILYKSTRLLACLFWHLLSSSMLLPTKAFLSFTAPSFHLHSVVLVHLSLFLLLSLPNLTALPPFPPKPPSSGPQNGVLEPLTLPPL